jgi:CheY-like chemotaxis protein
VDLPVVAGPAGANPQPAAVVSGHAEMPRRVLVVDDNKDAATGIVLLLSARGHQAAQASSGNEALDLATRLVPNVAILDTGLPDMTGGELAVQLRNRYGALITLISLSGFNERPEGFDHYLVKPAEFPDVLKMVEHDYPAP